MVNVAPAASKVVLPNRVESETVLTGGGPAGVTISVRPPTVTGQAAPGTVRRFAGGVWTNAIVQRRVGGVWVAAKSSVRVGGVWTAPPQPTVVSLLPVTLLPTVPTDPDSASVELGLRFRSSVNAKVLGVRFYKGSSSNSGTHTGSLWSSAGTSLATVTFADELNSGWQAALFATPVPITANTDYMVSYLASKGHYSTTIGGFASPITNGPLSCGVGAGTFRYPGGFPTGTYQNTNYFVDVICQIG